MKVSVIIPVYNVEKYLRQCVESVINQTFRDYEILLIDDGSTDNSGNLCDELSETYAGIRVIHKENGGLSDARNTGIDAANGEYIFFLDSDDYWEQNDCLETLVEKSELCRPDILNFRYKKYLEDTGEYIECLPSVSETEIEISEDKTEVLRIMMKYGLYLSSACNKMLRTEWVKENRLYFRKGITSEDIDWCARCMLAAERIGYSNLSCYVYRQRNGSISNSLQYRNLNDLKNNILECVRLGQALKEEDPFREIYYTFVAYQYGTFMYSNNLVKDERVKDLVEELKEYRWLLRYNSNKKVKMLYLLDRTIGYYNMIRCMKLYGKIRKG